MRKYLLSTLLCLFVSIAGKLAAQCSLSNVFISDISTSTVNGQCVASFDLRYDFTQNGGTKFAGIFVYLPVSSTQTLSTLGLYGANANKLPTAAAINAFGPSSTSANILSVIQINTDVSGNTTAATFVNGNNTVGSPTRFQPSLPYTVTTISAGVQRFQINNIQVVVPNCSQAVTVKADVVGGQDRFFSNISCAPVTASFVPNAPVLTGLIGCASPRYFIFSANLLTASTVTFTAKDAITGAILAPAQPFVYQGGGAPTGGIPITSYENITLYVPAGSNASYGQFPYASGTVSSVNPVVLEIQVGGLPNANTLTIENGCIAPLPVTLQSFEAKRTKEKVNLTWVTATEINNSGFDIQRKTGNGDWRSIAFMFSQANDGNSNSRLTYTYADINNDKGVSQYRLRQVDTDKRSTYSAIRSVKGETQAVQTLLFPNPSFDGKANIVFEDKSTARNISISDVSGRLVKQYRNITAGSLQIDNLESGIYTIHITDLNAGESTVEKLIIMKR